MQRVAVKVARHVEPCAIVVVRDIDNESVRIVRIKGVPSTRLTEDLLSDRASRLRQILSTANQFKAGHRICVEITSMDVPTGTGAMTNVEYIPYHVCSSKTVTHRIYRDADRPSHLLRPIIPG
jgi:hypothetical protein